MIVLSNFLIHIIIFGILLQLLVEVKSQQPDPREAHTATFINDKLYILGGQTDAIAMLPPKESFLYLDVSVPFNTNELKWYDLSGINIIPSHRYAASGANNNKLILYGGESLNGEPTTLVYTFDTRNNTWRARIPAITDLQPNRLGVNPIIDNNGLMYLFSGGSSKLLNKDDMLILDTINLNFKKASLINAPSPRVQYGAVLLPNQNIIYMGGFNVNTGPLSLNEVYLYDTKNDIWITMTTYGSIPSARYSISSVLGLDGQRVIIYGGLGSKDLSIKDSVYVLDINNYKWYIPKISGKIPSNRAFHKAVLIEKYMVITFGNGYTQGIEDDILLLDISNNNEYIWTTSFKPTSSTRSNNTNTIIKISIIAGSSIGSILLIIGGLFLFKWHKNKNKPTKIYNHGQEINNHGQEIKNPGQEINNHGQEIKEIHHHGRE